MKKVLLATAATLILAGTAMTATVPAQAAITCEDAAKMKYPDSIIDRLKWKRQCKKAWKAATGKGLLNKLKS